MYEGLKETVIKDGDNSDVDVKKLKKRSSSRKKAKGSFLIVSLFLVFLLVACGRKETDETISDTQSPVGQVEEELTTEESTEETLDQIETEEMAQTDAISTEETEKNPENSGITEDPRLESFTIMDVYFEEFSFDISFDEKLETWDRTYSFSGFYDLNGDKINEEINAVLNHYSEEGQSYVEVNGIRQDIQSINPADIAYIIDLDTRDNYKEIAFYDYGPSDDQVLMFYRYDGTDLHFIGGIDRNALMDGEGRLISWFNIAKMFVPQFYSQWEEIINNKFVSSSHDLEQYIGQDYLVSGEGYFIPFDTNPGDHFTKYIKFEPDDKILFKNTKVKLIDILGVSTYTRLLNWYFVEMEDGQQGLMYFWIGD